MADKYTVLPAQGYMMVTEVPTIFISQTRKVVKITLVSNYESDYAIGQYVVVHPGVFDSNRWEGEGEALINRSSIVATLLPPKAS